MGEVIPRTSIRGEPSEGLMHQNAFHPDIEPGQADRSILWADGLRAYPVRQLIPEIIAEMLQAIATRVEQTRGCSAHLPARRPIEPDWRCRVPELFERL